MIKPTGNNVHQPSHTQPSTPAAKTGSAAHANGASSNANLLTTADKIKNASKVFGAGTHTFQAGAPKDDKASRVFEKVI